MSILDVKTLQSPTNFDLTLDAQGSGKDIIFKSDGTQVALISDAGLLTATTFAGSGASLTALPAAQLTGALPAISGASLTGLTSAQMPAGSILQVVQGTYSTQLTTSSTTFIDLGLDADITPSATSSKILIIYDVHYRLQSVNRGCGTRLNRDSTALTTGADSEIYGASAGNLNGRSTYHYLDSPSSTSAINYNVQVRILGSSVIFCNNDHPVRITLMEIAG